MKVGILCPFYREGAIGGVETVIRTLLERLPERGFSPSLVPFHLEQGLDYNNPAFAPLLQAKSIAASLSRRTKEFDIINSHQPFVTLPFALRKKTVMSVHVHSGDLHGNGGGFHPMRWAARNGIRLAEFASGAASREVTAVSEYLKLKLATESRIRMKKISVIYNGVDNEAIGRAADCESPFEGDSLNILCVGRVFRQKGFDSVLRTLNSGWLGKAHLHIAGPLEDTEYIRKMKEYAAKNGLTGRFHLLGAVPEGKKYALMRHADVVALPSRFEGLSVVAIEALACSSAIIASDIPPLREALGDAAMYFTPGDERAIAEAARRVLSGSAAATAGTRRRALSRSKKFGIGNMVDGYVRAYEHASG